jgi:hypothetical protein
MMVLSGRKRVAALLVVVLAVGVAAVASASAGSGGQPAGQRTARQALALWKRFLVNAEPRPVIVPGCCSVEFPSLRNIRVLQAAEFGSFTLKSALPRGPSTLDGYALISAGGAARELRSGDIRHSSGLAVLHITKVRFGRSVFLTEYGNASLPAWEFFFREFRRPVSVLAVKQYPTPRLLDADPLIQQAAVSDGGTRLKLEFFGGPAGTLGCDERYTTFVVSSRVAVAVSVVDHGMVPPPDGEACDLDAVPVSLVVRIPAPLGKRILLDGTSAAAVPAAPKAQLPQWHDAAQR